MRKLFSLGVLSAIAALPALASAHGGFYFGPPASTPGGPTSAPRSPVGPGNPGTTPGPGERVEDPTQWQHWWAQNQAPYLRLKSHIRSGEVVTGSDEYRLGKGSNPSANDALRVSASTIRTVIIPALLEALRTESSNDIQSSCMIALAKLGDPEGPPGGSPQAREVLREISRRLISSSQELAETAAVSLGISGGRESIALLTAVLENDLAKLRGFDLAAKDTLNVRTRAFAAYGLGLIGCRVSEYDRLVINATLRRLLEGEGKGMASRDLPAACLTSIGLT
ncbi:MAG: HEAT repeat domain-containing protein, partial [Planctomycetota bacterium]